MKEHTCETSRTLPLRINKVLTSHYFKLPNFMPKSIAASCGKWSNTEKIEKSSKNCCDRVELACSWQLAMRVPPVSLSPWDWIFHEDMQIHFIAPLSGVTGSLERVAVSILNCGNIFLKKDRQTEKEYLNIN